MMQYLGPEMCAVKMFHFTQYFKHKFAFFTKIFYQKVQDKIFISLLVLSIYLPSLRNHSYNRTSSSSPKRFLTDSIFLMLIYSFFVNYIFIYFNNLCIHRTNLSIVIASVQIAQNLNNFQKSQLKISIWNIQQ